MEKRRSHIWLIIVCLISTMGMVRNAISHLLNDTHFMMSVISIVVCSVAVIINAVCMVLEIRRVRRINDIEQKTL